MFFCSGRQPAVDAPTSLAGVRVLMVDSSRFVRRLFTIVFSELGASVETAVDGPETVRIASERVFDVIVVDAQVQGASAEELCDDVARVAAGARKPIIVLYTGSVRRYQVRHGSVPGSVDAFVVKDASGDGLVQRLRQLLDERDRKAMG